MNWKTIFAAGAIILFTGNLYAQTIRIAGIGANDGNNATDDVCASGDLDCTIARIDATTYNAMSVAELRANYDVLLFTWATEGALNADWTTRILPYLNLGGGVIFEDGSSPNIADLAPAIIGNVLELGSSNVIAVVPGLTDGITNSFTNNHLEFTAWDPAFAPFLELADGSGRITGLYGDVGNCRMVATGPDNDFHGWRGGGDPEGNNYRLLVNEIAWVSECVGCDPDPRTAGYWHRQCLGVSVADGGLDPGRNGRGAKAPTEADFEELLMECTDLSLAELGIVGETTCSGIDADPPSDVCERALKQLSAVLLNLCSGRLKVGCPVCIDSSCGAGSAADNVGDLIAEIADDINSGSCKQAAEKAALVNEGEGLCVSWDD